MRTLLRIFGVVFIVVLLTVVVFRIRYAYAPRELLTEVHRAEEVERLHQAALRRLMGKYHASQEWMMQRCTWGEAMQRMQELDQEMEEACPGYAHRIGEITGHSAKERNYLLILHHVETALRERPEELAAVLRRLEKDSQ